MANIAMKVLRTCLIEAINVLSDTAIDSINANEVLMLEFQQRAVDETKKRLRDLGHHDLIKEGTWNNNAYLQRARSVLGNAQKMIEDLRNDAPPNLDIVKFQVWTQKWKQEFAKRQRSKDLSASSSLPKKLRLAQDDAVARSEGASGSAQVASGSGIEPILRTRRNHMTAHVVGIPFEAIVQGPFIGEGSYGSVRQVKLEGISFFPSDTLYCAKMYKGTSNAKLAECQKEAWMQKVNGSLVRCIAFTTEPPWVTIFPLYNGGSINDILFYIPFKQSHFRYVVERLARGEINFRPSADKTPSSAKTGRIKGFIENVPHILHALIDGLKAAHTAGIVHCDLHARNIVLDFTKDNIPRVGIIDWGLMLITGQTRSSEEYCYAFGQADPLVLAEKRLRGRETQRKRPWWAPELVDPECASAYTKESDIYAIGWLFRHILEFWKVGVKIYMSMEAHDHPDYHRLMLIEDKVNRRMVVDAKEERITCIELDEFMKSRCLTQAARAQRPLLELGPSYNY